MPSVEKSRVLVVDDEAIVARAFAAMVQAHGHDTVVAHSVPEALAAFDATPFNVVLTDVRMGALGGFDLLHRIRERSEFVPVVMITGEATIGDGIDAIQAGAYDYLSKPVRPDRLGEVLGNAIQWHAMAKRGAAEGDRRPASPPLGRIIGRSLPMLQAFNMVARVAGGDAAVLILGEHGTGKEMVAKELHARSPRSTGPFVAVNMASIAAGMAESDLFGHRRGSFTSAMRDHRGMFEQAHGGTLFFDEIGDLDLVLQAKLLRTIQEKRVKPVGAEEEVPVDVRIVSATNRDLRRLVEQGRFREDLYFRLNVVTIQMPPLRERPEDIPALAEHFLTTYAERSGKPRPRLTDEVLRALVAYRWPGNVRELENVINRAVQLSTLGVLTPDLLILGESVPGATVPPALPRVTFPTLQTMVDDYIRQVLEHTKGNITQAARILDVSRRTLQRHAARHRPAEECDTSAHPE